MFSVNVDVIYYSVGTWTCGSNESHGNFISYD